MPDLTHRLYAAAEQGVTHEEITRSVCRELTRWLKEEHTILTASFADSHGQTSPAVSGQATAILRFAGELSHVGHPNAATGGTA